MSSMPVPFLQRSHVYAAQMLHKAGLKISHIPQAIQITREAVEVWLQKELESGNAQQVLQVLKGQVQEKGPKLLLDRLQDMVLMRLMLHLGLKGAMATNIATLLLPFVLKRVFDLARQNPRMQTWWRDQQWRQQIPTLEQIKTKMQQLGDHLTPVKKSPEGEQPLFI